MAKKKSTSDSSAGGADASAKPYVVLARKYRPQTFDDMIGQDAMVRTLRNAFATGRIAQGYMLTGVRGVGKTTTARILARALNYETDDVSAPTVDMPALGRHCADIIESRHPDVIEMDAASNTGVDNMREIIDSARYRPILARYKVFIVDEVHMLSKGAFNALLKTLEEPPEHVKFIFATTEIRKVPVTVLSRCQRFDLRRVDVPMLSAHLKRITANEGAKAEDEAIAQIARAAGGSVRDGLSILDQAIAMGSGTVTEDAVRAMLGLADRGRVFDLLELLAGGDAAGALGAAQRLHHDGAEALEILSGLAGAVHAAARVKAAGDKAAGEEYSAEERRRATALAAKLSVPVLSRAWQMLLKGIEEAARAPDPFAAAEMILIRIAYAADLPPPDDIIRALGGGAVSGRSASGGAPAPGRSRDAPVAAGGAGSALRTLESPKQPPAARPAPQEAPARSAAVSDPRTNNGEPPQWDGPSPDDYVLEGDPALSDGSVEMFAEAQVDAGEAAAPVSGVAQVRTFGDVVALASQRRDARLKIHLEEDVSLVKFDAVTGSIDLFLLPGAPREFANDLREKLNQWTGRRWMVMLSKVRGGPTLGEVRRERDERELAALKAHPAVAAVLEEFPDAKITVRRTSDAGDADSSDDNGGETGTG